MAEAVALAKKHGLSEIRLDHWDKNEEAESFFKQFGFEYYNYKMKKYY